MKLIKTVKDKEYEMQCSEEQAEILLKDSRYRKADDNSAAEKAVRGVAEKAEKEAAERAEKEKAEKAQQLSPSADAVGVGQGNRR